MVKQKKMKFSRRKNNVVDYLIILFFLLLVSVTLVPLLNILSLSVSDDYMAIHNKGMLFPTWGHITIDAYRAVLGSSAIYRSFLMSLVYIVVGTSIHIGVTICAGFAISIKKLPLRNLMLSILLLSMLFGGGLIPTYLTISSYGLIDTFWVFVLPSAANAYHIILIKNYIGHLPAGMIEAAEIDGANAFNILYKIIIPLSVPIIATLSLFFAVGKWNDWGTAFFYVKKEKWLYPFQNVLRVFVVDAGSADKTGIDLSGLGEAFKSTMIVISILPVTIMYLFMQKYLVKGLFVGSVKG